MAKRGAQRGNKNAAKEVTGHKINLYLNSEDMRLLRLVLEQHGQDISNAACFALARSAAGMGIDLLLRPEYYEKATATMNTIIKASGPGPSYAEIKRIGDSMSDPRDERNHMLLSDEQEAAYQTAVNHVKRNDIEAAHETLQSVFERVIVEQGE